MTGIYGFSGAPQYQAARPDDMMREALDAPLSIGSTLLNQAVGGVGDTFGVGPLLKTLAAPSSAPTSIGRYESPEAFRARQAAAPAMTQESYRGSPYYRENIPWDAGMTEDRAATFAAWDDAKRVREFYASKRPIAAFLGGAVGQATDPINYIPVAGPLVKAAAVARFGRIGGAALTASLDAAANTALASVATAPIREQFGDDVSFQATVSQIAMGALIGGAFGTIHGGFDAFKGDRASPARVVTPEIEARLSTLKNVQDARIALNEAIGAVARGEDLKLSPNATEPMQRIANAPPDTRADLNAPNQPASAGFSLPPIERPEFKTWFGESKIIDDSGKPLVAYHGTGADFDRFQLESAGSAMDAGKLGRGFYFSTRPDVASGYAQAAAKADGSRAASVMPVYLSVENPLVFDAAEKGGIWSKLRAQSKAWGIELDPMKNESTAEPNDAWAYAFSEVAQEKGFDGVVLKFSDGAKEINVFRPSQIKSRFNTGAFSRSDPRVIDTTPARPEPPPEGRREAEAKVGKPDDYKALADQYRVDPQTGGFLEEGELRQVEAEGRLSGEDATAMAEAQKAFEDGAAYGDALKAAVACLI